MALEDGTEDDDLDERHGPRRGVFPPQPKRPPAPTYASEKALLKAMRGVPAAEASLRISTFCFTRAGVTSGLPDQVAVWKADYRRIMDVWRKQA